VESEEVMPTDIVAVLGALAVALLAIKRFVRSKDVLHGGHGSSNLSFAERDRCHHAVAWGALSCGAPIREGGPLPEQCATRTIGSEGSPDADSVARTWDLSTQPVGAAQRGHFVPLFSLPA
jgi:hypothetical protein